jgi:hypothetical protein
MTRNLLDFYLYICDNNCCPIQGLVTLLDSWSFQAWSFLAWSHAKNVVLVLVVPGLVVPGLVVPGLIIPGLIVPGSVGLLLYGNMLFSGGSSPGRDLGISGRISMYRTFYSMLGLNNTYILGELWGPIPLCRWFVFAFIYNKQL